MALPVRGEDAFTPIPAEARIPRLWAMPLVLIAFAFAVLAVVLVLGVITAVSGVNPTSLQADWRVVTLLGNAAILSLAGFVALWVRYGERRPVASAGLTSRRPASDLLWVFAGMVFAVVVSEAIARLTGSEDDLGVLWRQLAAQPGRVLLGGLVLLLALLPNSIAEELIFRGWAMSVIGRRLNLVWAVGITSMAFGAVHVPPTQWADPARLLSFVSYTGAGVAFAAIALRSGGLLAPIAFHTGFNALLLTGLYADVDLSPGRLLEKFTTTPLGTETLAEAVVWLGVQAALAAGLVWLWWRGRRPQAAIATTFD